MFEDWEDESTEWYNIKKKGTVTIAYPTTKTALIDLGLRIGGCVAMYGIGLLVGDILNNIPYVNQTIPDAVKYVSHIDVEGNLDGLLALVGGIYGYAKSGLKLDKTKAVVKKIVCTPVTFTLRK